MFNKLKRNGSIPPCPKGSSEQGILEHNYENTNFNT